MEALGLVHAIETVSKNACNQPDSRTVEIIFTSPPYRKKRIYDDEVPVLGNEKSPKEYAENMVSHLGDTFFSKNLQNIPHRVTVGLQDEGWVLQNTIIWKKTNLKPVSSKDNLSPSCEFIFHLVKTYQ